MDEIAKLREQIAALEAENAALRKGKKARSSDDLRVNPFLILNGILGLLLLIVVGFSLLGGGSDTNAADDPSRPVDMVKVTGMVTLDGQPMTDGQVMFVALDGRPPAIADVVGGNFSADVSVGSKLVRVLKFHETGKIDEVGQPILASDVAAKFNGNSTLKADIKKDGENILKFDVTSK